MKLNDSGDFCVLYVEADDDRDSLVQALSGQKKPVVILLADQARLFRSPEDFNDLKHVKRRLDASILFVIPDSEHLTQLAARHGFPAYPSMDALSDALMVGSAIRQRRPTVPLAPAEPATPYRKTRPLTTSRPLVEEPQYSQTLPLVEPLPAQVPPEPMRPRPQQPRHRSLLALAILMLIALLVAGLGSFMVLFRGSALQAPVASAPQIVGHVSFLNSEQVSASSNQGIDDEVLVDLSLPAPAAHKSYYAWLLGDHVQSDMLVMFLGALPLNKGRASLFYHGDAAHTNLIMSFSRFLVTEEDAGMTPVAPSPDLTTWRFYGEFSQTPLTTAGNVKGYSFLDHLRHLLAADPTLDAMELPGGLNTWFYNNTSKLLEWTTSMREPWEDNKDIGFVRRQSIRVLDYLDGVAFVSQDLPPNTPVLVNARLGSVGLLEVAGPGQDPPSYIAHIVQHLNGLLQAGKFSPPLRAQATQIVAGLDNIQHWLEQVRSDARQIMRMTDAQLRQPATLSLINDMITNVTNAFAGQPDPVTGQMHEGISWIHEHMQSLATIDISPYRK
ncbi:MAG TPA: hypothetical protein VL485_13790 [Ktedonobacteraceae bacterium]|jgi:hypothetical protein|nr:hypothetical protein [Ktedonobacteraceae bacterium]